MAGYPKIWTFIRHERWFKKLKASQRGAFLEMILIVKEQQDNGHIVTNSVRALAHELSINRKVMGQLLSEMTRVDPPPLVIIDQQPLDIYFPKYLKWQQMTLKDAIKHVRSGGAEITHPLPEAEQSISRAEQSILLTRQDKKSRPPKPKQTKTGRVSTTNPDHKPAVEYWCDQYEKIVGFKYDFISRDAKHISDLLKVFTFDQYRYLVDYILTTDDEWIADGRRTLGILYSIRNQVVQRIKAGPSKIPKRSRDNITTITEYLDRRKADDERAGQKQIGSGAESPELDLSEEPTRDGG